MRCSAETPQHEPSSPRVILSQSTGIVFVMHYGERVKKDPSKSLIYNMKAENEKQFMSGGGEGTDCGCRVEQRGVHHRDLPALSSIVILDPF
jgi:hypothetical protein